MLTRMKLGNFKSWQNLDLELAPITVLFGTNSSGKSSVLQALLMLKQTANSFDPGQHINFGGGERDYIDLGSYQETIYNHEEANNLELMIDYIFNDNHNSFPNTSLSYDMEWVWRRGNIEIDTLTYRVKYYSQKQFSYLFPLRIEQTSQNDYTYETFDEALLVNGESSNTKIESLKGKSPESCYRIPSDIYPFYVTARNKNMFQPVILQWFNGVFEQFIVTMHYIAPLRDYPRRYYQWRGTSPYIIEKDGRNVIDALIADQRQNGNLLSNVSKWMQILGIIDQLELETIDKNQPFYIPRVKIGNVLSSLFDVGFGISQVLPVITMLFFVPEGSIVLLEQPELHLHPAAQAKLADLFLHVAETRKLQLIIESHSEHLLTRLQRRVAEPEYPFATPENIKTYFCTMGENGSEIQSVQIDEYGQILNYPKNFFGDISGDLDALADAALARRREELSQGG